MIAPGPLNSISDVDGITVGNAEDHGLTTGVTVVLLDRASPAVVDHRGGGVGSRGSSVLAPGSEMPQVHAITLSGGSGFGLDAPGGVTHGLRKAGRGYEIGGQRVPIVPGSIIFDLLTGGPKDWEHPPWWDLGHQAYQAAGKGFALGNAGAGMGATAGPLKGGLGTASFTTGSYTIGAIAVANPVGSVVIPGTHTFRAWHLAQGDEVGVQTPPASQANLWDETPEGPALANTTLAVLATDAKMTRDHLHRIAIMAQDGMAQTVRPIHSPLDGDTVYVLSTMSREIDTTPATITRLGTLAADVVARSIMRGVFEAGSLAGIPSYRERHGR